MRRARHERPRNGGAAREGRRRGGPRDDLNEGIADRVATFETEPRTPEQIARQLADKGDRYPTVVVDRGGQIVAWASAGSYRNRPAYAGVAEHSVYVARGARGTGAGRAALEGLIRAYAQRGFWKIVSRILPENTASAAGVEREVLDPGRLNGILEARTDVGQTRPACAPGSAARTL
jgi:RimJ/RimL family protein N-acetyltransferase